MVSSTGWIFVGELAITPQNLARRRLLLQCLAEFQLDDSSSFDLSLSSWNNRAFSIAITAWSRRLQRSAISLSVKGRTSVRQYYADGNLHEGEA